MRQANTKQLSNALSLAIALPLATAGVAYAAPSSAEGQAATNECRAEPTSELIKRAEIEPLLTIDATCIDPYFNVSNFVVTSTRQNSYTGVGGPISYTEIKGYFRARDVKTNPLPTGVTDSPTLRQQDYVIRIPDKKFFRNRSMQIQHPVTAGTIIDDRLAFTNGAMSVNHVNAGPTNTAAHWRHSAAATKIAEDIVRKMYGTTGRIYAYYWGCSGGGQMAQAAAEGQTGVWAGVIVVCPATRGNPAHAFQWTGHFALALSAEKRARLMSLRAVGNGVNASDGLTDAEKTLLYAGLNAEEQSVLNEVLAAGYPLNELNTFLFLSPITGTNEIFYQDPTYEDDFWSKPGYEGSNPPSYLAAAKMDGFATITAIERDAAGAVTAVHLDPRTIPTVPAASASPIGTTGQRFYVYRADGRTRVVDPDSHSEAYGELAGSLDRTTGVLTLSGKNSPVLLGALVKGAKIRVNNRFLLAAYFYPRHTIVPGYYQYDQYRNADGTPKYPQRPLNVADITTIKQGAGVLSLGNIKTKVMLFQNLSDFLAFPSWVAGYANTIEERLGKAKADQMLRVYYQERGGHTNGGIVGGVFNQALIDMMAWAEKGIAPKPSSQWTFELPLTQVILSPDATIRRGLQPVVELKVDGSDHATVDVNQSVSLAARLAMPPSTGKIVQYNWTYGAATDAIVLPKALQTVDVARTVSFTTPGNYIVRLTANGQRDGLVEPANQTLAQNYKEVRVTVNAPPARPGVTGGPSGEDWQGISGGAGPTSR
ncbi:PKD domain-containing protein [Sphingobium sufflavum]|uniref:PKD domain-containing protein n=1 Tax=Sphingobium sufflavum TaxID=1129547 RepID=UPI001F2E365E|nr:PKD domain-containing protein [Sphingobium sufflavum]MCE7798876.1 PKD domain-containing protein [Sphingobium sufflavum]